MINITFPSGLVKQYNKNITGFEIASQVSLSLAKEALVIEVNGNLIDLSVAITEDANIKILTSKDEECLSIIRHDAAHITAEAVKELFPDVQVTIGPSIENGFFYDFAKPAPFTLDDLAVIEKRMHEIVKRDEKITREVWDRDKAIEYFKSIGENYKAEIILGLPEGEDISLYRQGEFADLCRGPHAPSTSKIKFFKLTKLAGAYWRGDSNNEMLQRIYGTAWASQKQLDDYLHMIEEAEKRDHRKIGKELELFHFQPEAQGMPFWHEKGWSLYLTIEHYIRNKITKVGYREVKTPMLVDRSLWETSGHWEMYQENMFTLESDDRTLALKPMSCPCHVQIFKQGTKSYRDLPMKMAEFGSCHRYEPSGALHGLMRVRNFVQDDGHIFCGEDHITSETIDFCKLLIEVYQDFGFKDVRIKFATRPEVSAGSAASWEKAESALLEAITATNLPYTYSPGEGAFYGPKLEFVLKDAIGRDWQCGTLQVDLVLPGRLDAHYIDFKGEKTNPVMLHRAIIGSFERFIGILIEQYAGKFPIWLAPVQVAVTNITNDSDEYAKMIFNALINAGIRAQLDISSEKVNYKIRHLSTQKIPIIAVVGKQEMANNMVNLRKLDSTEQTTVSLEELIAEILLENAKYL